MANEYMKKSNESSKQERKMFANKKANIAMIVVGAIIVVAIIGLGIWANV